MNGSELRLLYVFDSADVTATRSFSFEKFSYRSDEGLTLETSAFLLFTVANLRFQPSC